MFFVAQGPCEKRQWVDLAAHGVGPFFVLCVHFSF